MTRSGRTALRGALAISAIGIAVLSYAPLMNTLDPESERLRFCEYMTLKALKSPTSYRRAEAIEIGKTGETTARISFDAANSFGAIIRSHAVCEFTDHPYRPRAFLAKSILIDGQKVDPIMMNTYNTIWSPDTYHRPHSITDLFAN